MSLPRSWLFVPADRPERYEKATDSGAGAVILDLEDAVSLANKSKARADTAAWLSGGHAAWVRVNDSASPEQAKDVLAIDGLPRLAGVVVPKVERPADITEIHERLGVAVLALVETARGIENAAAIANTPGLCALALGTADLRLDVGLGDDPLAWAYARSRLVFASRDAGLTAPIDGPTMDLDDCSVTTREAERARAFGFAGKLCIHPRQVAVVNEVFRGDAAEIAWARRVIAAAEDGAAARVDGQMIDRPRLELARRLVAQFEST